MLKNTPFRVIQAQNGQLAGILDSEIQILKSKRAQRLWPLVLGSFRCALSYRLEIWHVGVSIQGTSGHQKFFCLDPIWPTGSHLCLRK